MEDQSVHIHMHRMIRRNCCSQKVYRFYLQFDSNIILTELGREKNLSLGLQSGTTQISLLGYRD